MSRVSLVSGRVIAASCHYFTIRPLEEGFGQLTKKSDGSRQRNSLSKRVRHEEESLPNVS